MAAMNPYCKAGPGGGPRGPGALLLGRRLPSSYSDDACSFITSMATAECAMAAPALISAATQIASMISLSVAPFWRALLVCARMQYGHCVT
jgi:hypothetical protein